MKRGLSIHMTFARTGWRWQFTKLTWGISLGILTVRVCFYDFEFRYMVSLQIAEDYCALARTTFKHELERYVKSYSQSKIITKKEKANV